MRNRLACRSLLGSCHFGTRATWRLVLVTITSTDPSAAYMFTRSGLDVALCGAAMAAAMAPVRTAVAATRRTSGPVIECISFQGGRRYRHGTVACAPSHGTLRCNNRPGARAGPPTARQPGCRTAAWADTMADSRPPKLADGPAPLRSVRRPLAAHGGGTGHPGHRRPLHRRARAADHRRRLRPG